MDIGTAYINEKMFCHYIAECKRKELFPDGSTDKGNIDDELFSADLV